MQHSAQKASGQREERVPLAGVISVRESRQGSAPASELEADGMNVSIGGIAMRARFAPQVGSLLECTFTCPPTGELVSAQGEVIWLDSHGPGQNEFGVRFLELDTKSATALRQLVQKAGEEPPRVTRPRLAQMFIDGLQGGIEAELKLVDDTRVVLEQPLSFLRVGRGVDLSVPGRGQERGRIASIELRHGPFETPRLVFGILLDDAPSKSSPQSNPAWLTEPAPALRAVKPTPSAWGTREDEAELERSSELALQAAPARVKSREDYIAEARAALGDAAATETLPGIGQAPLALVEEQDEHERTSWLPEPEQRTYNFDDEPAEELERTSQPELFEDELPDEPTVRQPVFREDGDESELAPLTLRSLPAYARALLHKQAQQLAELRARIAPTLREQAENLSLPDAKERVLAWFARVRLFVLALLKRRPRTTSDVEELASARKAPRLRMQRTTSPGLGPDDEQAPGQNVRRTMTAVAIGLAAVGLIAYALAPSATPAKVELPARIAEAPAEEAATPAVEEPLAVEVQPAATLPVKKASKEPVAPPVVKEEVVVAPFGEAEVPNGRVFTLRMNGPIAAIEGQPTANGFTVKVPGRTPVDPARPIASAHRAVKRALFMNQGKYAELTIEFLPGFAPRYQVRAKGDALEITLERL